MLINRSTKQFIYSLIISLFCYNNIQGQDLIITESNDTLNCKISKIDDSYIYFYYQKDKETKNTLIPIKLVKKHKFDYFDYEEIQHLNKLNKVDYERLRIALNVGYSYAFGKIDDNIDKELNEYFHELKSGYNLGADFTYFYRESFGLGVKYARNNFKNKMENILVTYNDGSTRYGSMSDNISISYIAPQFTMRVYDSKQRNALYASLSVGYLAFKNDSKFIDPILIEGNTLGSAFDIAYDIRISEKMSIGIQVSWLSGTITEYYITQNNTKELFEPDNKEDYIGINELDFSIGVRLNI